MYLSLFLISAFIATLLLTLVWLRLAIFRGWFDIPNDRSSHSRPTPKGGGVGFILVFTVLTGLLDTLGYLPHSALMLCVPAVFIAILGLLDDLRELDISVRLLIQLCVVTAGIVLLPVIPSVAILSLTIESHWILVPLLLIGWMWLINLYNFMDGIDGLAAMQAIFVALSLSFLCTLNGAAGLGLLSLMLAAVVAGFLFFNLPPARLFMGDAGSNFLGYILVALSLLAAAQQVISLWTMLILLGAFIVDSSLTLVARMVSGQVWYYGHNSHAYQKAARLHGSHARVVGGVTLINVFWLLPMAWISVIWPEFGPLLMVVSWGPLIGGVLRYRAIRESEPAHIPDIADAG